MDQKPPLNLVKFAIGLSLYVLGPIAIWFVVGYIFYRDAKNLPLWYMAVFFSIPVVQFAVYEAATTDKSKFKVNLAVEVFEEGCFAVGILWMAVAFGLSELIPVWLAFVAAVPLTLASVAIFILTYKILVRLLMVFRR